MMVNDVVKKVRLHTSDTARGPILCLLQHVFSISDISIVSSHGFLPLKETVFKVKCYHNTSPQESYEWVVHGETERITYEGTTSAHRGNAFFNYCLVIEDPNESVLDMIPVPLVQLEHHIKTQTLTSDTQSTDIDYENGKKALGEAFGSKRMKKIIHDKMLHMIHADHLQDVSSVVVKDIKEATEMLATVEQVKTEAHAGLPIPPPNIHTTQLEEVYSLSDIVSAAELSVIHIKSILRESNERVRASLLPFKNSRYINEHLTNALSVEKKNKHHVKLLYYASLLMAFYTNHHSISKRELLAKKLGDPPAILVDNLITRFSESTRLGTNCETIQTVITPYGIDKILCYLFALCLIIDNFSVNINFLAQDLSLSIQKCKELFKTLGCKIQGYTEAERLSMNLSKTEAKTYKKAVLTLPFEFVSKKRRLR